ncbi:VOC family protein [Streptosporangium amethystogenes subsp. fukuiense]|uniref:VOC family protein n=1 Tax=Streptosporangium amethystogenes subsp. fukuiense TaxID=698418 RepID=A0ABW2SZB4_9ACTN
MVGEIHHVAISVRDLEKSIPFYRDGLGLRMTLDMRVGNETMHERLRTPPGAGGRAVYFQGPTRIGQLELIQWDLPVPADSRPKRPGDPGVFSLSFQVPADEIQDVYDRLVGMGVDCYHPPATSVLDNYGPITMFMCEDPDQIQVEFVSLPTPEQVRAFRAARRAEAASADTPEQER